MTTSGSYTALRQNRAYRRRLSSRHAAALAEAVTGVTLDFKAWQARHKLTERAANRLLATYERETGAQIYWRRDNSFTVVRHDGA